MSFKILIVEDEDKARNNLQKFLTANNYETIPASTLKEAKKHFNAQEADVILLDVRLPDGYGTTFLHETKHLPNRPPIIVITAFGDIDMAVEAMRNGAHDFFEKPIDLARLSESIERATRFVAMQRELHHYRQQKISEYEYVPSKSPLMEAAFIKAQKASKAGVSILITGETGTGKEIIAKFIHESGPRKAKPFIDFSCPAVQDTMIEAELFGYEKGAFTHAEKKKPGLLETAEGGILFLDELALLSQEGQGKLLKVVENKTFRRMAGTVDLKADVQIIAATNANLEEEIIKGNFREDLYFRLKIATIHLPPLREHKEDIPELIGFFIRKGNLNYGKLIEGVSPEAMDKLITYDWPGNIRVLRATIEEAMIFSDNDIIEINDLPSQIVHYNPKS